METERAAAAAVVAAVEVDVVEQSSTDSSAHSLALFV